MKFKMVISWVALLLVPLLSCKQQMHPDGINIVYLHHSTGNVIWEGNNTSRIVEITSRISNRLAEKLRPKAHIASLFSNYNKDHNKNYNIKEVAFPKTAPYGWNNYPYDYYNIWVRNAGENSFMEEPTLEILAKDYQVVIFKHCFPVCNIQADLDSSDINSEIKTIANYKLQYDALKRKLLSFPEIKFILFTGAVQVQSQMTDEEALRAQIFFNWVRNDWDLPGDNIYLWDLYELQTEGGLYFREDYAGSPVDSHPNIMFARKAGKLLFARIIDIIQNKGSGTLITGEAI